MTAHKIPRLLRLASTVKTDPGQTPEQLWRSLGVQKAQYHRDKKALEEIGFVFKYDRKQRQFIIENDPFLPVYHLMLTETFALTMAVRQLSAAGDYVLTYDALNAINKIVASARGVPRDLLTENLREAVLREGFGCQPQVLQDLHKALGEQRRVSILSARPTDEAPKLHTVDPYQIYFKRRALCLDAYCPEIDAYRLFRVNRIHEVRPTGMTMPRRADYMIWPKNLELDTHYQAVTMNSMHAVDAPQCLPARGYCRLGYSVTDPVEDAGQREVAP